MSIEFDSHPIVYWFFGYVIALGICLIIYAKSFVVPSIAERMYLLLSAVLLLMMRLPVLLFNRELNPDESQMLTQAMTLVKDPVFWRSVDGTTGGPLGSYFLLIPSYFRGVFDYTSAHSGALILVLITLAAFYFAIRNWFGMSIAMAVTFPMTLFYAFVQQNDFVHFSSEHVPISFMAIILLLISIGDTRRSTNASIPFFIGSLIALLPFGKLQTLPMVTILVLWVFYLLFFQKKDARSAVIFVLGGISTLLVILLLLIAGGVTSDFFQYYIIANFQYGDKTSWWNNLMALPDGLFQSPSILVFVLPQLLFLLAITIFRKSRPANNESFLIFPLLWIAFTLLAISRTGSGYLHYWLFVIIPLALIFANWLIRFQQTPAILLGFGFICLSGLGGFQAFKTIKYGEPINIYPSDEKNNRHIPFSQVALEIKKYAKPGEYLVIWGWNCQYYVETQMPQGVAENHSIRSIFKHPLQEVYLQRYLTNLIENKPSVVVDAVGKNSLWAQDKATQGLSSYPDLFKYVSGHYTLVDSPDDVKLYLRNDLQALRR